MSILCGHLPAGCGQQEHRWHQLADQYGLSLRRRGIMGMVAATIAHIAALLTIHEKATFGPVASDPILAAPGQVSRSPGGDTGVTAAGNLAGLAAD